MRISVIRRRWTVGVLGVLAAFAATCVATGCASATTAGGAANPSVAASTPSAPPSSPDTGTPSASPSSGTPEGDGCVAASLAYQAQFPGAGAGNYYDSIVLVNHGAGACQLAGYPSLYYTDASGAAKLVPTVPETSAGPPYIVAAGGQVQFTIHTPNGYSGYSSTSPQCAHPMTYHGLSVEVSAGRVPLPDVGIDLKCGDIRLTAWGAPQPH
jgi:hypothetical protein